MNIRTRMKQFLFEKELKELEKLEHKVERIKKLEKNMRRLEVIVREADTDRNKLATRIMRLESQL